ncbi:MAG: transporter ATP-binding protein [Symbiobacteriaceae bacterium]|jgi:ATP-binding cassette subfamily B protein|nr:transporter ATP-binding protein [Symbiobacteriaceae bacterium]
MKMSQMMRKVIGYQWGLYTLSAVGWLLFHAWPLLPGLVAKAYFDRMEAGPAGKGVVVWFALLAVAVGAGRALVTLGGIYFHLPYRYRVQKLIQGNLLHRVLARPGARALPATVGDAISTLRDDVNTVMDAVDLSFDGLAGLLYAGGCVAVLLGVDWQVTLLVFVPIGLVIGLAHAVRVRQVKVREESRASTARLTGALGEIFGGVQALQVAGAEGRAVGYIRALGDARQAAALRERRQALTLEAVFENTAGLGAGLVLLVAAGKIAAGTFSVGDLALFTGYLVDVAGFTGFLGFIINTYRQGGVSLGRLVGLLQGAPAERLVAVEPGGAPGSAGVARLERLEVRNLTCRPGASDRGITDISFAVARGSFTVITGRVGAGKSTLVRAILGLLEPQAGEVRWNGERVERLEPPRVAYTAQVPTLLSGTLRENILLGWPAAPGALDRAIRSAVLEQDLAGFPQGLETPIGTRGLKLSGGQVQRTAAARMFVRDAELLIFDDLSSALDAETEALLWQRVRERNATCLVVSNRPGALALADQVLHLEEGRLVSGTY